MYKSIIKILHRLKPGILKKYLLLIAGIVWLFAGFMLSSRGMIFVLIHSHHKLIELILASIIGTLFYYFLFIRISFNHIIRIKSKTEERPCMFSFFDFKGYILMIIMIYAGVTLRHLKIYPEYLYTFYIGMGIPLIISSLNFFNSWFKETGIK